MRVEEGRRDIWEGPTTTGENPHHNDEVLHIHNNRKILTTMMKCCTYPHGEHLVASIACALTLKNPALGFLPGDDWGTEGVGEKGERKIMKKKLFSSPPPLYAGNHKRSPAYHIFILALVHYGRAESLREYV